MCSCQEAGVLGAVAEITGAIQAMEALNVILGVGEPLIGRFLELDGLSMTLDPLKIKKNPKCPLCAVDPKIETLSEYSWGCEGSPNQE